VYERALAFLQHFATGLWFHFDKSDPNLFVHGCFTRGSAIMVSAGALPIIAVDQGREAIFVLIHAYLNPLAISQPISRLNPWPHLPAAELSSQDFCGRPVSF
jgi:hypothetical protein